MPTGILSVVAAPARDPRREAADFLVVQVVQWLPVRAAHAVQLRPAPAQRVHLPSIAGAYTSRTQSGNTIVP